MFSRTDRHIDNPIFYKVENYLDHFLVPETYVIPNFVKTVEAVFEIYESCDHEQTDNPIFYKVETYLDRLLTTEIQEIPNFVKIVRAVLEIVYICIPIYIYILARLIRGY